MNGQKPKQKISTGSKKPTTPAKIQSTVLKKPKSNQSNNIQSKRRIVQNFLLIWLDSNIDESNINCQNNLKQLRRIVNTIYIFTNADQCVHFLNQIKDEKVFMIISGSLGQSIIPNIHEKSQLDVIYIFCDNKVRHEQWANKWTKIKGVYTHIKFICEALHKTVKQCNQDSISVSFVSNINTANQNLDQLEPSFMYTQIFKEILIELEYSEQSIKDLVNYCREQYSENIEELKIINQFEKEYHPDSSVWWYTRECFTYQMLNRALRTLESDIIMKMGFFIRDLHNQIEKLHLQQFSEHQETINIVS